MTSSSGEDCSQVNDGFFLYTDIEGSTQRFEAGSRITITLEEPIRAIYIKWYYAPDPWTLEVNGNRYPYGQKGYVQEYVEIPKENGDVTSVSMVLGESAERIIDIYAVSDGPLSGFVHIWEDPCEDADVLFVPYDIQQETSDAQNASVPEDNDASLELAAEAATNLDEKENQVVTNVNLSILENDVAASGRILLFPEQVWF